MVKIKRSFPAPASLEIEARKSNGSYCKPDVTSRLSDDFHNKCYICGLKKLQDPQVEHLLPHRNRKYPERIFDWNNLFWSCSHCNSVKNKDKYDDGIIDCCKYDPESRLSFELKNGKVTVCALDKNDMEAGRTAELICETFNLKNSGIRICASQVRYEELTKQMNILYHCFEAYRRNPNSKLTQRKLKALLRRESAFAAFKRNYIRNNSIEKDSLLASFIQ